VPANTSFNAGASTAGWVDQGRGVYTFAISSVAAQRSGSVTFAVTVVSTVLSGVTGISNTTTIADDGANGADQTPGDNTATDNNKIGRASCRERVKNSDGGTTTTTGTTVSDDSNHSNDRQPAVDNDESTQTMRADT